MTSDNERPDERIRRLEESLSNLARNFDLVTRSPSLLFPVGSPPRVWGIPFDGIQYHIWLC